MKTSNNTLVIVGLGNPGKKYKKTRHNAGFMFLDQLRSFLGYSRGSVELSDWELNKEYNSLMCNGRGTQNPKRVVFIKPQTFMNHTGRAVGKYFNYFNLNPTTSLVIAHDDLDLPLGKFKIQRSKSPKGHNGVRSVELAVKTINFLRVRIGIESRTVSSGHKYLPKAQPLDENTEQNNAKKTESTTKKPDYSKHAKSGKDYVLQKFTPEELQILETTMAEAVKKLRTMVEI